MRHPAVLWNTADVHKVCSLEQDLKSYNEMEILTDLFLHFDILV